MPMLSCRGSATHHSKVPNARTSHAAIRSPAIAPPISRSTRLSSRSCRISRPRAAPSAARMASSVSRSSPRASIVVATFAQAIRRTRATAPSSRSSASPRNWSARKSSLEPARPPRRPRRRSLVLLLQLLLRWCSARLLAVGQRHAALRGEPHPRSCATVRLLVVGERAPSASTRRRRAG